MQGSGGCVGRKSLQFGGRALEFHQMRTPLAAPCRQRRGTHRERTQKHAAVLVAGTSASMHRLSLLCPQKDLPSSSLVIQSERTPKTATVNSSSSLLLYHFSDSFPQLYFIMSSSEDGFSAMLFCRSFATDSSTSVTCLTAAHTFGFGYTHFV